MQPQTTPTPSAVRRVPQLDRPAGSASAPLSLSSLRDALLSMVAGEAPDLSARQLAVLLTLHLEPLPQTVRGLASVLNISKPAITRAIDRLEAFGFASRRTDPQDRRSVLLTARTAGAAFLAAIDHAQKAAA